jgi:hypothetical protein
VLLCGANPRVYAKLERADLIALLGPGGYHEDLDSALRQVDWGATLEQQPSRTDQDQEKP